MHEQRSPAEREHDAALQHTAGIVAGVVQGRTEQLPRLATSFPPMLGPDESVLTHGAFELLAHRPLGDGTYVHDSSLLLATGRHAGSFMAGALAVRAIGNRRRRTAAQRAAVPRWTLADRGGIFVSTHGFYLQTPRGLFPWAWPSVQACDLVGPGQVQVQGVSDGGPVSWIVVSCWSELLFALWAMARHPDHPQFRTGTWAPRRHELPEGSA